MNYNKADIYSVIVAYKSDLLAFKKIISYYQLTLT